MKMPEEKAFAMARAFLFHVAESDDGGVTFSSFVDERNKMLSDYDEYDRPDLVCTYEEAQEALLYYLTTSEW